MHAEERVARDEEAKAKKDKKDKKDAGSSIAGIPVPGILRSPS
jgi:hypothetical protein